jgi:ubiquitin-like protein Pup
MPTHDNNQIKRSRREEDQTDQDTVAVAAANNAELDNEVDSLLDEIDEILEVNAEDFVKSFVQKGGQ